MTNTPEERSTARSIQRGIPILFIVVGVFALRTRAVPGSPPADFVAGFVAIAFAGALFLKLSFARWLALGACFLAIVGACALPALLFIQDPFREFVDAYSSTAFTNAMLSVFGFAFGGLGYKGLKYYRSDLGRIEHTRRSLRPENVTPERSTTVLYSAVAWLVLLALGGIAGLSMPRWVFDVMSDGPGHRAPLFQSAIYIDVPRAVTRETAAADSDSAAPPAIFALPDLVPLDLCIKQVSEGRKEMSFVTVAYTNNGDSTAEAFLFSATQDGKERSAKRFERVEVPPPNALYFAEFAEESSLVPAPGTQSALTVTLDVENGIEELDENNNFATFKLIRSRRDRQKLDLPPCTLLRLRIR